MKPDSSPRLAAAKVCERCRQPLPPDQYKPPPWCQACERAHLHCVRMMVLQHRDLYRVEFWPCDRATQLGRTRRYQSVAPLFDIVRRAYDPVNCLARLAYVLHRTNPVRGDVDLRLTLEQLHALQPRATGHAARSLP